MRYENSAELTNEARAEISWLNLCLARRKKTIVNRIPFKDLEKWVNEPLDDDVQSLDNDNERPRLRLSDDQVWQEIIKITGVSNSSRFQLLDKEKQRETLRMLSAIGASVRQLQRLTGLGRGVIQRV